MQENVKDIFLMQKWINMEDRIELGFFIKRNKFSKDLSCYVVPNVCILN